MELSFDLELANGYSNQSQRIRVLSESWVLQNSYCPSCGYKRLVKYENNMPAADFYCSNCKSDFELKSTRDNFGKKINDGAFHSMIGKIANFKNPNFFLLNYTAQNTVKNFFTIPKHFFIPEIIEERKPLSNNAKRAGWIGCNILISQLPYSARIYLVQNEQISNPKEVKKQWAKTSFLQNTKTHNKRWVIEIMAIIDKFENRQFQLTEIYEFEKYLKNRFPNNNFVKEKIRQQLQVLRDKGYIRFISKGLYIKV